MMDRRIEDSVLFIRVDDVRCIFWERRGQKSRRER